METAKIVRRRPVDDYRCYESHLIGCDDPVCDDWPISCRRIGAPIPPSGNVWIDALTAPRIGP